LWGEVHPLTGTARNRDMLSIAQIKTCHGSTPSLWCTIPSCLYRL